MAKRLNSNINNYTICVNVTEQIYNNLAAISDQYGLKRSALIRALLENIDDECGYARLLGPADTKKPAGDAG